jgi:hypothetical protein
MAKPSQYEVDENSTCGFTQRDSGHGEIELVIYYDDKTTENTQLLFRSLFEHFLGSQQLEIFRYLPVICNNADCGEQLARNVVLAQLKKNKTFSFCHDCGEKLTLPDPAPLTQLSQQDEAEVVIQQTIAKQRTAFEAALVRVKRLVGDKSPNCFISYAWGVHKHESWVNIDFTATEFYFRRLFDMIWQIFDLPFEHPLLEDLQASMTPDDNRKRR